MHQVQAFDCAAPVGVVEEFLAGAIVEKGAGQAAVFILPLEKIEQLIPGRSGILVPAQVEDDRRRAVGDGLVENVGAFADAVERLALVIAGLETLPDEIPTVAVEVLPERLGAGEVRHAGEKALP